MPTDVERSTVRTRARESVRPAFLMHRWVLILGNRLFIPDRRSAASKIDIGFSGRGPVDRRAEGTELRTSYETVIPEVGFEGVSGRGEELAKPRRLLKKLQPPPSGTSGILVFRGGSQAAGRRQRGAYWVVRGASGATKKWHHATSAAETVRRPGLLNLQRSGWTFSAACQEGREIPSFRIRDNSVVRFIPRRVAAPEAPPTIQSVS